MDKHDHGQDDHEHDAGGHDAGGHGGVGKYIAVFIALCVLTAISYLVGNSATLREKTPGIMWAMMMAVSCAKASLVILFFMHLKWEANWKYVLTVPASIMSVFLMLMLIPDIGLRTRWYAEERWLYAPVPGEKHEGHEAAHEAAHEADKHSTGDEGNIFEKKTGHSKAQP
ncbi:MAG: cytochrome C oxidase subunit IV family protein [Planctomycetales bacterium]|nr:cytochrome C oxidase subunit IV family protein [Planctomycetales bacterium]